MRPTPNYLAGYPATLVQQIRSLIENDRLGAWLLNKYPHAHSVRTDKALYDYVQKLKSESLRSAGPLSKVAFDSKLHVIAQALGTHSRISRVQGIKLKSKNEIRVASVFKAMPPEFLRLIVAHELAHIKVREHNADFYQLCRHIEPDYHQIEFDLRVYLQYLAAKPLPLWSAAPTGAGSP